MFKRYSHRFISVALCASLLITSADAAEVASFCFLPVAMRRLIPHVVRRASDPAFFTEQAIVQRLTTQHFVHPSIGSLYLHLHRGLRPVSPSLPWFTWFDAAGITAVAFSAGLSAFHLLTVDHLFLEACGNLWIIWLMLTLAPNHLDTKLQIHVPVTIGEDVLKPGFVPVEPTVREMTMEDFIRYMLDMLDVRGRLQAGLAEYSPDGAFVVKINAPKRGRLSDFLLMKYHLERHGIELTEEDGVWRLSGHVRAPTAPAKSGNLDPIAAHPHQYLSDREEMVGKFVYNENLDLWVFGEEKRHVKLSVKVGHNGDVKKMRLHGRDYEGSGNIYAVLDRILGVIVPEELQTTRGGPWWKRKPKDDGTIQTGDSKTIGGRVELGFTLGRAPDSARFAYHKRIVKATDQDASVRFPPQEWFQGIGTLLTAAIAEQTQLGRLGAERLTQVPDDQLAELKSRFAEKLSQNADLKSWPAEKRAALADGTVQAYFRNNLYAAAREMMPDMEGTFGLVIETTDDSPDNEEMVAISRSQQLSLGFNQGGNGAVGSSSRHALNLLRYRLDLDNRGEILGLTWQRDPATGQRQFRMHSWLEQENRVVPQEELETRLIDRHLDPYMEKPPEPYVKDRVIQEMNEIPESNQKFKESMANPESWNSQTVKMIVNLLDDIAAGRRKKADLMFVGSEKSLEAARTIVEGLRCFFPVDGLHVRYVTGNRILKEKKWPRNMKNRLGITEDTIPFIITASGGDTFDTGRAAELLTAYVTDMVIMSGLWDIELAAAVGQGLKKDSKFSRRIINTYGGWSLAEPATKTDAAMEFALTQTFLEALRQFKERHPGEKPLGMIPEAEDLAVLQNGISTEFMQHAGAILGVRTNAEGVPVMKDGKPVLKETDVHKKYFERGVALSKHSMETIYVTALVAIFYAVAVYFRWPVFPSSFWQQFISAHLPSIPWVSPVGAVLLIAANVVFVLWVPYAVNRLYRRFVRRVKSRHELKARRGTVTAVLIGPAKVKLEQLYSKVHGNEFGDQEPNILGADNLSALHRFSHRVRRGTYILQSVSSAEGIDQTDSAASDMIKDQASLIQHMGAGPVIYQFSHLPYKTPIRAPFEKFEKELAREIRLNMDQAILLHSFLETLPERAHESYLWQLSRRMASDLGLKGQRKAIFEERMDDYIDRQVAFEDFFKVRFADAENWLGHYVTAHAWAHHNAHPFIFRWFVAAIDHLPKFIHDRLLLTFPWLSIYIDVARTFVGTSRLTTASPYEGEEVAALVKERGRKLKDLTDSTPETAAGWAAISSAVMETPTPVKTSGYPPAHESQMQLEEPRGGVATATEPDPMQEFLDLLHGGSDDTSLIMTREFLPEAERHPSYPIYFPAAGEPLPLPEGMDPKTHQGLEFLLKEFYALVSDFRPYESAISVEKSSDRIARFRHKKKGLFIWDQRIFDDIADGNRGALLTALLTLYQETRHHDRWVEAMEKGSLEPSRHQLEMAAHLEEIEAYAMMEPQERMAVRGYLRSSDNLYDVHRYGERIYAEVDKFLSELGVLKLTRDDQQAFTRLRQRINDPLDRYITEVLAAERNERIPVAVPAENERIPSFWPHGSPTRTASRNWFIVRRLVFHWGLPILIAGLAGVGVVSSLRIFTSGFWQEFPPYSESTAAASGSPARPDNSKKTSPLGPVKSPTPTAQSPSGPAQTKSFETSPTAQERKLSVVPNNANATLPKSPEPQNVLNQTEKAPSARAAIPPRGVNIILGQILMRINNLNPKLDSVEKDELSVTLNDLRTTLQDLSKRGGTPMSADGIILEKLLRKLLDPQSNSGQAWSEKDISRIADLLQKYLNSTTAARTVPGEDGFLALWVRLLKLFSHGTQTVMAALIGLPGSMTRWRRLDRRREEFLTAAA